MYCFNIIVIISDSFIVLLTADEIIEQIFLYCFIGKNLMSQPEFKPELIDSPSIMLTIMNL